MRIHLLKMVSGWLAGARERLGPLVVGGLATAAWTALETIALAQGKRGAPPEKPAEPSYALGYFLALALIAIGVAVVGRPHRRAKELNADQG